MTPPAPRLVRYRITNWMTASMLAGFWVGVAAAAMNKLFEKGLL